MLIKSLLHNVAIVNRITVLFRIFSFQSLFLQGWKELDYDKFSVTSIKKAISEVQRRFCAVDNSEKVKSLVFRPDGPVMVPDTLLCSTLLPSGCQGNTFGRSSEFEKILVFLYRHGLGRQLAFVCTTGQHGPDVVLDKEIMCRQFATVWARP